eukprot:g68497.t1
MMRPPPAIPFWSPVPLYIYRCRTPGKRQNAQIEFLEKSTANFSQKIWLTATEGCPTRSNDKSLKGEFPPRACMACGRWHDFFPPMSWSSPFWFTFCVSCAIFLGGTSLGGLLNAITSTLELRYKVSSTDIGFLYSFYNVFGVLGYAIFPYFVQKNRFQWLARGCLLVGVANLLFGSVQFFGPPYTPASLQEPMVATSSVSSSSSLQLCGAPVPLAPLACHGAKEHLQEAHGPRRLFWYFFLFRGLQGIGNIVIWSLSVALVNEKAGPVKAPVYLAAIYFFAGLGGAAGFLIQTLSLKKWVDVGTAPPAGWTTDSPGWVGRWWEGFLICGFLQIVISPLFYCFFYEDQTQEQAGPADNTAEKEDTLTTPLLSDESGTRPSTQPNKNWWRSMRMILCNVPYILVAFGNGLLQLASAMTPFFPKVLQSMYDINPSRASFYNALITPGGLIGILSGGVLCRLFFQTGKQQIKFVLLCKLGALACGAVFFLRCPFYPVVGVNTLDDTAPSSHHSLFAPRVHRSPQTPFAAFQRPCNQHCGCESQPFVHNPICGADGLTYANPCYAGCTNYSVVTGQYNHCQCVSSPSSSSSSSSPSSSSSSSPSSSSSSISFTTSTASALSDPIRLGSSEMGSCAGQVDCHNLLYAFVAGLMGCYFFGAASNGPSTASTLRLIPRSEQAVAVGISLSIRKSIGNLPGPLLIGLILDHVCDLPAMDQCGKKQKNCWYYHRANMATSLGLYWVLFASLGVFFIFLGYVLYPEDEFPIRQPALDLGN